MNNKNNNRKFTTFDNYFVEFLKGKGINYINSFTGRSGDIGYDYEFISNLSELKKEYRSYKAEIDEKIKQDKFETMLEGFLKTSKEKYRESVKQHTKSDEIKIKKDSAKRRKI